MLEEAIAVCKILLDGKITQSPEAQSCLSMHSQGRVFVGFF